MAPFLKCIACTILCLTTISHLPGQVNMQDSLVLVTLYNTLDGPNWTEHVGWLEGPVSSWHGITIENDRVTEINLQFNNLTGEFPSEIGQLTALKVLNLAINNISGDLPAEIGDLLALEELTISKNDLTGAVPTSITQLTSLHRLVLLGNFFTGPLPDLSPLQALEHLVIGGNDFAGPFPEWVTQLSNLQFIDMTSMGLNGEVPETILEALPELDIFKVFGNNLEGDVGLWFHGSTPANDFQISRNNFSGALADGVVDLEILAFVIDNNEITGIPDFSSATEMKRHFFVDDNKLGFHELEKALGVQTYDSSNVRLGPQKRLLANETLVVKRGDAVTLSSGSTGMKDSYQWYKNAQPIPGATGTELLIDNYQDIDAGDYHCVISHPDFAFNLERNIVTLETEPVSSLQELSASDFQVYPNPATDIVTVRGDGVRSVALYDLYGRQVTHSVDQTINIRGLAPGIYTLRLHTARGKVTRNLIKN